MFRCMQGSKQWGRFGSVLAISSSENKLFVSAPRSDSLQSQQSGLVYRFSFPTSSSFGSHSSGADEAGSSERMSINLLLLCMLFITSIAYRMLFWVSSFLWFRFYLCLIYLFFDFFSLLSCLIFCSALPISLSYLNHHLCQSACPWVSSVYVSVEHVVQLFFL